MKWLTVRQNRAMWNARLADRSGQEGGIEDTTVTSLALEGSSTAGRLSTMPDNLPQLGNLTKYFPPGFLDKKQQPFVPTGRNPHHANYNPNGQAHYARAGNQNIRFMKSNAFGNRNDYDLYARHNLPNPNTFETQNPEEVINKMAVSKRLHEEVVKRVGSKDTNDLMARVKSKGSKGSTGASPGMSRRATVMTREGATMAAVSRRGSHTARGSSRRSSS